jgi:hypothetical protein
MAFSKPVPRNVFVKASWLRAVAAARWSLTAALLARALAIASGELFDSLRFQRWARVILHLAEPSTTTLSEAPRFNIMISILPLSAAHSGQQCAPFAFCIT